MYAAVTAAFAVPFQLLATDTPAEWARRGWPKMSDAEKALLHVTGHAPAEPSPAAAAGAAGDEVDDAPDEPALEVMVSRGS